MCWPDAALIKAVSVDPPLILLPHARLHSRGISGWRQREGESEGFFHSKATRLRKSDPQ